MAMEDRARRLLPVVGLAGLVVVAFLVRHGEMGDADRVRYLTVDLRHAYFPLYEATWSWIREG